MGQSPRWQFWIDRGGTFTDCLGLDPSSGDTRVVKLLSSDRAPLDGIRSILGLGADESIPACDIRMGTTLATNALLERKGTACGLLITRGFRDLLQIGTQARPEIFDLEIHRPGVLYSNVVEIAARADASGRILERPERGELLEALQSLRGRGLSSLAVVVLHAYAAPELEREIGVQARAAGFSHVALSSELATEIGMTARGDTACVDAYLTPLLRDYVATLLAELPDSTLRIMQSGGGLTDAAHFRGPHAILSGPAGGVVAYAHIARQVSEGRAIGFDMGGTSTDVSRFDGEFERVYETETAGVRIRTPTLAIHSVAAGGGSICRYDGYRLRVGPESAGAEPGPLCYGHADARDLTLTDVNLALGRVRADRFPFELERARVDAALDALAAEVSRSGQHWDAPAVAAGLFAIANANMAEAIRQVSVARGYDVRDYMLVVFGGAGGQHACALARRLGIRHLLFHPHAGVLSAYGMGLADVSWDGEIDLGRVGLDAELLAAARAEFEQLEARGRALLEKDGFSAEQLSARWRIDLRYRGTETSLTLELAELEPLLRAFEALHRRSFGYARPGHAIEAVVARVEVCARNAMPAERPRAGGRGAAAALGTARIFSDGEFVDDVPVLAREDLAIAEEVTGPALILEQTGTIVVDRGFSFEMDEFGRIHVRDTATEALQDRVGAQVDPVQLEIFNNLFMSIAEQMGTVLRRTALSTNIRERLDFSCAIFDPDGGLVANAPHIPVHLGAMGETVRAVREAHPDPAPGSVFASNDPAAGGSHLPDITVVTPVHGADGALRFFAASRGHHADVGGITPGSMPPFSRSLSEEGVVLRALRIVADGRIDEAGIQRALGAGAHPARNPLQNLADLEAQIAANQKGCELLDEMVARYGLQTVRAYMQHVQDNAAAKVADEIAKLPDGEYHFEDALDDGSPICVRIAVRGAQMEIDFSGTGPELEGNLNAPRAVTIAAVIYVLRALVGEPIPLNAGCLRPVSLHIPAGSLLAPGSERAVAGGNVETSQRVVDVLLGALEKLAASQGTMNNLTFGTDQFGYYETIAGGAGAGRGFDGASGVHTHMTNTRITDPEVLESRFPVRLCEFSLRRGSGGDGQWRGGDGLVREIEFLAPMRVSLISERRVLAPHGLDGGQSGAPGRNLRNGERIDGKVSFDAVAGDKLRIETPGGGGFGEAKS
jgi:5-oxoprolinase (ATP-hydrolysing)